MSNKVNIYATGLCTLSCCAPANMPLEQVAASVNLQYPTGIDHSWTLSDDSTFANGDPHPRVCEQNPARRHYLFVC